MRTRACARAFFCLFFLFRAFGTFRYFARLWYSTHIHASLNFTEEFSKMPVETINGYTIDTDRMPDRSTVIVAGLTENLLLEQELMKRGVSVIGIDSNPERTIEAGVRIECVPGFRNRFFLQRRTLTPAFEKEKQVFTDSEGKYISTMPNFRGVDQSRFVLTPTISLQTVLDKFANVSLVVLDLHGEEYKLAKSINPHCQLFIRFYQTDTGYDSSRTDALIRGITKRGYTEISVTSQVSGCIDALFLPNA